MKPDAMLVIDMQTALVREKPWHVDTLIHNIQQLLKVCRERSIPVIYVRHHELEGDLVSGSEGWTIDKAVAPLPGEKIIEKAYNSAFRQTDLQEHLQTIGAHHLLICGMQTEYCVDTTVKVAFEFGYQVTVPAGTTGTFDGHGCKAEEIVDFYEKAIWQDRFAKVISIDRLINDL